MSYVIERGIPVPASTGHRRAGPRDVFSPLSQAMLALEVGASFLVRTEAERKDAASRMGKFPPRTFTIRKVAGQGWRVWRVE